MANWNYDPRLKERSADPAVLELQKAMSDMTRKLRVALRELDSDNIAPDFLPGITNAVKGEMQVVKGKAPNAYIGNDGEILKIVGGTSGSGTSDPLSLMPVGYVYISTSSTSPQVLFGGTWKRLEDVFLLAAGKTYAAGTTGGESEHTLTVDEIPSHTHTTDGVVNTLVGTSSKMPNGSYYGFKYGSVTSNTTGGGAAHNNMPPYLVVYAWERTA